MYKRALRENGLIYFTFSFLPIVIWTDCLIKNKGKTKWTVPIILYKATTQLYSRVGPNFTVETNLTKGLQLLYFTFPFSSHQSQEFLFPLTFKSCMDSNFQLSIFHFQVITQRKCFLHSFMTLLMDSDSHLFLSSFPFHQCPLSSPVNPAPFTSGSGPQKLRPFSYPSDG